MPRSFRLTWDKSLRQWVKVIRGRKVYFGTAAAKGDQGGYQRALERYERFLNQLAAEDERGRGQVSAALTPRQLDATVSPTSTSSRRKYSPRLGPLVARQFFNHQESRVSDQRVNGSISRARVVSLRYFLQPFVNHCSSLSVSKITADTLNSYRDLLLHAHHHEGVSGHTTYQRFAAVKAFLKWCWENEKIHQLPRNTRSAMSYGLPRPDTLLHFDWRSSRAEEVQALIKACRERDSFLELYVLLGLNCGFLHKDISDLRMNEVRWLRHKHPPAIERLRSKSNIFSRHVLWDRTIELLKHHAKGQYNSHERCFTRADNVTPLIMERGGRSSIPIKHRLSAVFRSVFPNDKRSFVHLRKTGASYCAQRFPGLRVDVLYLAHAPQDMAARFYAKTTYEKLDEALCYMEKDFGLTDRLVKRWEDPEVKGV